LDRFRQAISNTQSAEQDQERGAERAADVFLEAAALGGDEAAFAVLRFEALADRRQLGARGGERDAGLEPADGEQQVAPGLGFLVERQRRQQVEAGAGREHRIEIERGRQHAGDEHRLVVDRHLAADDVGLAAELLLPEAVAEDRRRRLPGRDFFLRQEVAAELRTHAEHVEEVLRDLHAAHALRAGGADQRVLRGVGERVVGGQRFEGCVLAAPVEQRVHARGAIGHRGAAVAVLDPNQALGLLERQRLQQHRVDESEHRRAGADAERERGHGDHGEAGRLQQLADGVTEGVHGFTCHS
jgi:hypothetical protein